MKVFRDIIRVLDADPTHPLAWLGLAIFSVLLLGFVIGSVYAAAVITFRDVVAFLGGLVVFAISLHKLSLKCDW